MTKMDLNFETQWGSHASDYEDCLFLKRDIVQLSLKLNILLHKKN